jgi:hypothetical protein
MHLRVSLRAAVPAALAAAVTLALTCGYARDARAEVVLSNYELVPNGNNNTGINQFVAKAVGITAPSSDLYSFTSLEAPIRNQTTTDYTAIATIRANDGNGNPGTILATLSPVVLPGLGAGSAYFDRVFTGDFVFTPGQTYWFVLETDRPATGSEVAWGGNTSNAAPTPAAGFEYAGYRVDTDTTAGVSWSSNTSVLNRVRINATVVPEPGTAGLLAVAGGGALLGGLARRWRRRGN